MVRHLFAMTAGSAISLVSGQSFASDAESSPTSVSALDAKVPEPYDTPTTLPRTTSVRSRSWEWYGWMTLLLDAPALALILTSKGQGSTGFAVGSVIGIAGAPTVHFAHGNLYGLASLSMRAAAIGLLTTEVQSCNGYLCRRDPVPYTHIFGTVILLAAVALDGARFSRDARTHTLPRHSVAPVLTHGLMGLALSGEL